MPRQSTRIIRNVDEDVTDSNKFGTFGGVFTPSILTILGVIMFMRANFVTGEVGILGALLILFIAKAITTLTTCSISAISTNMRVRGGGAYFMISRVLGPEFGGAIGSALFCAQALSVPFYILGFSEAFTITFPSLSPYFMWINFTAAGVLFVVAYVGAKYAIKAQYVIMAILALSILSFAIGMAIKFSPERFQANLMPPKLHTEIGKKRTPQENRYDLTDAERATQQETAEPVSESSTAPATEASSDTFIPAPRRYSFWLVFAIYFPAVTGILAGVNMSGDLRNPGRSIPNGTFFSITVGFLVYAGIILLGGGAFSRIDLVNHPFDLLKDNAVIGAGVLVVAGVFAASLSSALGSYLGAPRILQAIARDGILPVIKPFSKGTPVSDEPRRALWLTGLITIGILFWAGNSAGGAALDAIAAVITMFFLYTYGMINLAAFTERISGNPSFRPRFRYFHWITALLGGAGCVGAAFLINTIAATASVLLIGGLLYYLHRKRLSTDFGDARRGFYYSAARRNLLQLVRMEEDSKNWRPTILAFSGNPNAREVMIAYAIWLECSRGIVYLANIMQGSLIENGSRRRSAEKQLRNFCQEKEFEAFPVCVVADTIETGVTTVLQATAVGPMRPNLALFGWSDNPPLLSQYLAQINAAVEMGMSILLMKPGALPPVGKRKRIDIWWRGMTNGSLMVILGHLLQQNWDWRNSEIRVLRMVNNQAGAEPAKEALATLIKHARLEATAVTIVADGAFRETLHENSMDADCVFLGFQVPVEEVAEGWQTALGSLLEGLPTTILVNSAGMEDMMA